MKKRNRNDFIYKDLKDENLRRSPGWLNGQAYRCSNLENCNIEILDRTGQITIIKCNNCTIILGPCSGSVFIRESKNCVIYSISNQLRISDSNNITMFSFSETRPALDHCDKIIFAPIKLTYNGLKDQFEASNLNINSNLWYDVHDFTLEGDQKISPYYKLMEINDYPNETKIIDNSTEENIFSTPKQYGGELIIDLVNSDLKEEIKDGVIKDGLMAFNIQDNNLANKINNQEKDKYDINIDDQLNNKIDNNNSNIENNKLILKIVN